VKYIVDASFFITRKRLDGDLVTVPAVIEEVRDTGARLHLEASQVRVEPPLAASRKKVIDAGNLTGDIGELSPADIDVLAKALELNGILVSDDYAVQNVAQHLGIRVQAAALKVAEKLIWEKKCMACGKRFTKGEVCPVCGSPGKKRSRRGA